MKKMPLIDTNLISRYIPNKIENLSGIPAAVLIPIVITSNAPQILFTVRSRNVSYGEHVSFPGGGYDPADGDLASTALRETREETGICAKQVEIIGRIDDFMSTKGHIVSPFVGFVKTNGSFPATNVSTEVSRIFMSPLEDLLDPVIETGQRRCLRSPSYIYMIDNTEIWGLTASILTQFIDILYKGVSVRPVCRIIEAGSFS